MVIVTFIETVGGKEQVFFFSGRRRHTRWNCDWSSDVCSSDLCSQEFLVACAGLADELDLPIITHVQETRLQVVTGLEFYGSPIIEYLSRIKFLGPRTTLIHAVWLNPREIRALAETGATAQYNPWSNQTLGSGVQPVRALLDAGVNVSLGSDGAGSTRCRSRRSTIRSASSCTPSAAPGSTSRWWPAR